MKKKIVALNLATILLSGTAVLAQNITLDSVEVKENRVVEINLTTDPRVHAAVKVQNKTTNEYAFFDEIKTDSDGKVSFVFVMPETLSSGRYIASYCVQNNSAESEEFDFADFANLSMQLDAATTSSEVTNILSVESGNRFSAMVMGIDMTVYEGIANSDDLTVVHNNFLSIRNGTGVEENVNAFNKALGIYSASVGNSTKALELYNPEVGGQKYSELSPETKVWISSVLRVNVTDKASFEEAYKDAKALYSLNFANSTEIGGLISEHAQRVGIANQSQYTAFIGLSNTNKVSVYDKMVLALGNARTKEQICEIFNSAVIATLGEVSNNSSGGGGGGSSGGGSGSKGSSTVALPTLGEANTKTNIFDDISDYDWAEEAILALVEKNIVSGYEDETFRPANTVTREEFVKMAVCAIGMVNKASVCDFDDVAQDKWYYTYVASAVENGIISGVDERNFGAGLPVTRQDMAVIVRRCMGFIGKTPAEVREYEGFADEESISEYAKASVKELYVAGLISGMGDGGFMSLDKATRAQAAKVLYDALVK